MSRALLPNASRDRVKIIYLYNTPYYAVQAFARHRLDRVPFVGCPRSVVLARRQHFDAAQRPARHADMSAFFAYQAGPSAPASPAA